MRRKEKALHWLGVPAPEELGNASAVSAGTIRIDVEGRPFQSTKASRRRPSEWSRRWVETPAQLRRRELVSRLLTSLGFVYLGMILGVGLVAVIEGWSWSADAVSPLTLMLPGAVAVLVPRLWSSFVLSAPSGPGLEV